MRFLPTKINLLKLKEEGRLAKEALNILDRKREALIRELMKAGTNLNEIKRRFEETLFKVYEKYQKARRKLGEEKLEFLKLVKLESPKIGVLEKSIMGVHIFHLRLEREFRKFYPSPLISCKEFEEFLNELYSLFSIMLEYVELSFSVSKIARELMRTHKRHKALEELFIPEYESNIKYIEDILEEYEREDIFRNKIIKKKREGG